MLVLPVKGKKHEVFTAGEYARATTLIVHGEKVKKRRYAQFLKKIALLPKARKKKILAVRYQLDKGNYKVDERLNVATDRLIESLITNMMEEDETKRTKRRRQR
jgi:hypothetical protein